MHRRATERLAVDLLADGGLHEGRSGEVEATALVHQHHAPLVVDSAVAIVQTVYGGVELVVRADGHHQELTRLKGEALDGVDIEVGLPRRGGELALVARGIGRMLGPFVDELLAEPS